MSDQDDDISEKEARIAAEVAEATEPLEGLVPDELVDELRFLLDVALTVDPHAHHLLRQTAADPAVDGSAKVDTRMFGKGRALEAPAGEAKEGGPRKPKAGGAA